MTAFQLIIIAWAIIGAIVGAVWGIHHIRKDRAVTVFHILSMLSCIIVWPPVLVAYMPPINFNIVLYRLKDKSGDDKG